MGYIQELRELIDHKRIILPGCIAAIRNKKGQLLMQQRTYPHGVWGLPGGLMELGESTIDTVKRKVMEETGLKLGELSLFGVYSGQGYQCIAANGDEFDVVTIVYTTCEYEGEVEVMDDESLGFEWFDFDKLPDRIAGTHSKIISDYIKAAPLLN
ncbi:MAG: NUDIX domain-containing protein [Defluviitaleaceae bacterium]|nr:NUDIX domain-containing protein [Defluviitaleaceae bacterium]